MFHAMLVKMPMKKRTAAGKKPRIGTDWRISRTGIMRFLALLFVAAT